MNFVPSGDVTPAFAAAGAGRWGDITLLTDETDRPTEFIAEVVAGCARTCFLPVPDLAALLKLEKRSAGGSSSLLNRPQLEPSLGLARGGLSLSEGDSEISSL